MTFIQFVERKNTFILYNSFDIIFYTYENNTLIEAATINYVNKQNTSSHKMQIWSNDDNITCIFLEFL